MDDKIFNLIHILYPYVKLFIYGNLFMYILNKCKL
jgi:hypothetical protein